MKAVVIASLMGKKSLRMVVAVITSPNKKRIKDFRCTLQCVPTTGTRTFTVLI